jgi:hypothetical protein
MLFLCANNQNRNNIRSGKYDFILSLHHGPDFSKDDDGGDDI